MILYCLFFSFCFFVVEFKGHVMSTGVKWLNIGNMISQNKEAWNNHMFSMLIQHRKPISGPVRLAAVI